MFFLAVHLRDFDRLDAAERGNDVFDKALGRRGTGGEADNLAAPHPSRIQFATVGDEIGGNAFFAADLAETIGV
jgi:hypothetical protein